MNDQDIKSLSSDEMEFIGAEMAVWLTRLLLAGTLWWVAVSLVDRPSLHSPYVSSLRLGLWLFLVEILIATYMVHYTAPASYPLVKRTAFVMAEVLRQCWSLGAYVVVNFVIRWLVLTLLTGFAIWLFSARWPTVVAGAVPSFTFITAWLTHISAIGLPAVIRGTHLGSQMEAVVKAEAINQKEKLAVSARMIDNGIEDVDADQIHITTIPFGGVDLAASATEPHTLVMGTTGAGKTLILRMVYRALLMSFGVRRNRAMLNDPKREYYPLLVGMGVPPEDIVVTNAADARCVEWGIAADVADYNDAVNITNTLIPEDRSSSENQFFTKAVRSLVTAVIWSLHQLNPGKWDLNDVVNACRAIEKLKAVLFTSQLGRETYERYFAREAEEMVGGIIATLDARFVAEYQTIAAVWSRCTESFSLMNWLTGRKIILLGYDENSAGQDRMNQAIFERAARLICALPDDPESKAPLTILGLDEPAFLPKLPMLAEVTSLGRTKGLRAIFAPQDIDGMYAKYGEHEINAILAVCGNVAALRLQSPKTREWAAKFFGEHEAWETDHEQGENALDGGLSIPLSRGDGKARQRVKRETILPSEFLDLPPTSRANGLHGFFAIPAMGAWRAAIPTQWIDAHLSPRDPEAAPFIKRVNVAANPVHWTEADENRYTRPQANAKHNRNGNNQQPAKTPGTHGKNRLPEW